jgi:hypothetical protein
VDRAAHRPRADEASVLQALALDVRLGEARRPGPYAEPRGSSVLGLDDRALNRAVGSLRRSGWMEQLRAQPQAA